VIPAADYKPICCCHCHRQLALATPYRLLFNVGVYCDEPVALRCTACGARRYWRPLNETLDSVIVVGYTEAVIS
jgi:hypothetical protein